MSFTDVVAVVTGAGSGIGLATTELLAAGGARVAALDIAPPPPASGIEPVVADVADRSSLRSAAAHIEARFGRCDVVVANAGIGSVGTVEDNDDDEWHRVYDVNVVGVARTVSSFLPLLRQSPHGAIVTTASIVSTTGLPKRACYAASKGAVLALTMAMAADLAPERIRVNCVCPGTVDTPWVGRLLDQADDATAARAALVARQPIGRLGTATEIAAAIAFLADPANGYITGTALAIDGGTSGFQIPR